MKPGGEARFAGDVTMVVNPAPVDLADATVKSQGTLLVLRVSVPAFEGGDTDIEQARVAAHVVATVLYGPDDRTASGSVDIPTEELDAIKRSAVALIKRYGGGAQAQAHMNGAEALRVARAQGEYRGDR